VNIFQSDFNHRMAAWRELRTHVSRLSIGEACVAIDSWWQRAPIINYHLHWADSHNWPDPWTLLSENMYCPLTRAIGMCYTTIMSVTNDVELVMATDDQGEEHFLVLVDGAKYTMNWWSNSVLSISLADFSIQRSLSLDSVRNKIK
jgi:hypothetical protein